MDGRMSINVNELKRIEVLAEIKEKRLKQSKGARILGISSRQIRRLLRRFRLEADLPDQIS